MKKLFPLVLIILLLLPSCQPLNKLPDDGTSYPEYSDNIESEKENFSDNPDNIFTFSSFGASEAQENNEITDYASTLASEKIPAITVNSALSYTTTALFSMTTHSQTKSQASTSKTASTVKAIPTTQKATNTTSFVTETTHNDELRGVWISCYDYVSAQGKTKSAYRQITDTMFQNISSLGLNTAFVHLVAFSDAFYESDILPYSKFIAGEQGADLSFDPFEVMLESAAKYGISVHGWINPFRVAFESDSSLLSDKNPAKKILKSGNTDNSVCVIKEGIYYNPSSPEAHKLILDVVREIVTKYKIDGIHIDDYFYPSTDEAVDKALFSEYVSSGGKLSLADWRIQNINAFVSALYSCVKTTNKNLTVSISPSVDIQKNKKEEYADIETWMKNTGYADIIIPQIYFGFEHNKYPFNVYAAKWADLKRSDNVKLVCGLAAYKCALEDKYAGDGKNEWKENGDMLVRQLNYLRKNKNYSGFVLFSYSDITRKSCAEDIGNLKKALNEAQNDS